MTWLTPTAAQSPEGSMTRTATTIATEGLASISNATAMLGDTDETGNSDAWPITLYPKRKPTQKTRSLLISEGRSHTWRTRNLVSAWDRRSGTSLYSKTSFEMSSQAKKLHLWTSKELDGISRTEGHKGQRCPKLVPNVRSCWRTCGKVHLLRKMHYQTSCTWTLDWRHVEDGQILQKTTF